MRHIADSYPEKLKKFVADIRQALGNPLLPFIAGELSDRLNPDLCASQFNRALRGAEKMIPNFAVVSSENLPLKNDKLHFTSAASRLFGERYFKIYKQRFI